jgi:chromosome segregation ATPase
VEQTRGHIQRLQEEIGLLRMTKEQVLQENSGLRRRNEQILQEKEQLTQRLQERVCNLGCYFLLIVLIKTLNGGLCLEFN